MMFQEGDPYTVADGILPQQQQHSPVPLQNPSSLDQRRGSLGGTLSLGGGATPLQGGGLSPSPGGGGGGPISTSMAAYYLTRIKELEDGQQGLQVALEASRQRENSLYRTVEGFKELAERAQEEKKNLTEEIELKTKEAAETKTRLRMMMRENDSLRSFLNEIRSSGGLGSTRSSAAGALGLHVGGSAGAQRAGRLLDQLKGSTEEDPAATSTKEGGNLSFGAEGGGLTHGTPNAEMTEEQSAAQSLATTEHLRQEARLLRTQLEMRTQEIFELHTTIAELSVNISSSGDINKAAAQLSALGGVMEQREIGPYSSSGDKAAGVAAQTNTMRRGQVSSTGDNHIGFSPIVEDEKSVVSRRNAFLELRVGELEEELHKLKKRMDLQQQVATFSHH